MLLCHFNVPSAGPHDGPPETHGPPKIHRYRGHCPLLPPPLVGPEVKTDCILLAVCFYIVRILGNIQQNITQIVSFFYCYLAMHVYEKKIKHTYSK